MRPPSPWATRRFAALAARPPGAGLVDGDGALVDVERLLDELEDPEVDAGVRDGDVEPPERLEGGRDGRLERRRRS